MYEISYRANYAYSNNTSLTGPWSDTISFSILAPDLPAINVPAITNVEGMYEVTLSWQDMGVASTYDIAVKSGAITVKSVTISENSYTFAVGSGSYTWELTRTNSLGQKSNIAMNSFEAGVFHKQFGGSGNDYARYVTSTSDGQYLILGSTTSKGDSQGDDWIFKLDQQGNLLWEFLYKQSGGSKLSELVELSDGSIVGFGSTGSYPDITGLIVSIDSTGNLAWEKTYSNVEYDQLRVKGVAELEGTLYMVSEGLICKTVDSSTTCNYQSPKLEGIDPDNGVIISSVQISQLNGALWDGVSSLSATITGQLLIGATVEEEGCIDYFSCFGAAIVLISSQGVIDWEWNSIGTYSFLNGRYAIEKPTGGYVLAGQSDMGDGSPLALFDPNKVHLGTYTYSGTYSNQKEFVAFSNSGKMLRLLEYFSSSSDQWPVLVSTDDTGNTVEVMRLTDLKRDSAYPAALGKTKDGGLIMVFTENQSGYNNPDIVVVKIGDVDKI